MKDFFNWLMGEEQKPSYDEVSALGLILSIIIGFLLFMVYGLPFLQELFNSFVTPPEEVINHSTEVIKGLATNNNSFVTPPEITLPEPQSGLTLEDKQKLKDYATVLILLFVIYIFFGGKD